MLNRIINAEEVSRKEEMLSLLRGIANDEMLEGYIRDDAANFLEDAI